MRVLSTKPDQKPCGNKPDLLPEELDHEPYCWWPAGHYQPRHFYVSDLDHDFAVTTKHAGELIAENPAITLFQKWTCGVCGRRLMMEDSPNHFHTLGHCEDCGGDTDIQLSGCNFLLVLPLGGKPK